MGWQDRSYPNTSGGPYRERPGSMSGGRIYLFRALGIPVRVDFSMWMMIAWVLVSGMQEMNLAERAAGMAIMFCSVLLHEFGHCITARWVGGHADEILLGPLGGLAMVKTPPRPFAEFVSTAGGPAVNAFLCAGTAVAIRTYWHVLPPLGPFDGYIPHHLYSNNTAYYLWWVCSINRMLLYFNVLPILPMDGGRMLYACLWRWLGTGRAWRITAWVGVTGAIAVLAVLIVRNRDVSPFVAYFMLSSIFYCCHAISGRQRALHADAVEHREVGRKAGWVTRWRARRRQRIDQDHEQRLDQILARISAEGIDALTRGERQFLERAREHRRTTSLPDDGR